jgi:hypothetical protein
VTAPAEDLEAAQALLLRAMLAPVDPKWIVQIAIERGALARTVVAGIAYDLLGVDPERTTSDGHPYAVEPPLPSDTPLYRVVES